MVGEVIISHHCCYLVAIIILDWIFSLSHSLVWSGLDLEKGCGGDVDLRFRSFS
jgi:hypothetical protein